MIACRNVLIACFTLSQLFGVSAVFVFARITNMALHVRNAFGITIFFRASRYIACHRRIRTTTDHYIPVELGETFRGPTYKNFICAFSNRIIYCAVISRGILSFAGTIIFRSAIITWKLGKDIIIVAIATRTCATVFSGAIFKVISNTTSFDGFFGCYIGIASFFFTINLARVSFRVGFYRDAVYSTIANNACWPILRNNLRVA